MKYQYISKFKLLISKPKISFQIYRTHFSFPVPSLALLFSSVNRRPPTQVPFVGASVGIIRHLPSFIQPYTVTHVIFHATTHATVHTTVSHNQYHTRSSHRPTRQRPSLCRPHCDTTQFCSCPTLMSSLFFVEL